MTLHVQFSPRSADDQALAVLALLGAGKTPTDAGRALGLTRSRVAVIRHRIMQDDIAYSGEPVGVVKSAYGVAAA
jgi:hypothetical protein